MRAEALALGVPQEEVDSHWPEPADGAEEASEVAAEAALAEAEQEGGTAKEEHHTEEDAWGALLTTTNAGTDARLTA